MGLGAFLHDGVSHLTGSARARQQPPTRLHGVIADREVRTNEDLATAVRNSANHSSGAQPLAEHVRAQPRQAPRRPSPHPGHYMAAWEQAFDTGGTLILGAAGPMTRAWDMAYLAHQFVPFHLGDDTSSWGWDSPPDRRARLALLYGGLDPEHVVDDEILCLHSTGMFL